MGALTDKLYILHGWTTNVSKWEPFLTELKKQTISPVFLKIPGLSAPIDKPWTLDDYVEWLHNQIDGDSKVLLLGHSNGGRIALAFAHKYPDKVSKLFLLDSAGVYHNDFITNARRNVFQMLAKVGKQFVKSEKARNALYQAAQETDYRDASPVMRETMQNLISVDLVPILQDIKTPTILIWGKEDKITPFTDAQVLRQGLSNAKLYGIDGARHSPQYTHISQVVQIIKENLG